MYVGNVAQPVVHGGVAYQSSPQRYISPFAMHGGYYQPPLSADPQDNRVPPPMIDPYTYSYTHNHPSYVPRAPIHPSEMVYQQPSPHYEEP